MSGAFSWCKKPIFIFMSDEPPEVSKHWAYKSLT